MGLLAPVVKAALVSCESAATTQRLVSPKKRPIPHGQRGWGGEGERGAEAEKNWPVLSTLAVPQHVVVDVLRVPLVRRHPVDPRAHVALPLEPVKLGGRELAGGHRHRRPGRRAVVADLAELLGELHPPPFPVARRLPFKVRRVVRVVAEPGGERAGRRVAAVVVRHAAGGSCAESGECSTCTRITRGAARVTMSTKNIFLFLVAWTIDIPSCNFHHCPANPHDRQPTPLFVL